MTQTQSDRWAALAEQIEHGAGLFRLMDRGLVQVSGGDRARWLDGMLTNDVARLVAGREQSGCFAALLTHQGRIVSDIQVMLREDAFWLEMSAQAVPGVMERFDKHIIADDVTISDISATTEWLGVEGPKANEVLAILAGGDLGLAADCWSEIAVAGCAIAVGRWGVSVAAGKSYRLLVPKGHREAATAALLEAGSSHGLVEAGVEVLEILRIVAGTPQFGAELDESVLPAEARLGRAISQTKGCYIGQEVVARMASRGRSSHRLVGLRFDTRAPKVGVPVRLDASPDAKKIGEITSVCESATRGPIALAFIRSAHAVAGREVCAGGQRAEISDLPFGSGNKP